MMLRSIVLVISLMFGGAAFADTSDIGDIFTPSENDHSLFIISKIFGNIDQHVLPGDPSATGPDLLGNVFRVFNIVTLALGVLMVIYTLVLAVLQTAHHGKMMGEKMSSMWVPVRIAFAIAMLIPKSNGYCIAQVIVMWLVVQGVGAADSLWNTALDYFEQGGSIGDSYETGDPSDEASINGSLNAIYSNKFMGQMLQNATCVASHNEYSDLEPRYSIQRYTNANGEYYIYYGRDIREVDPLTGGDSLGQECGSLKFDVFRDLDDETRNDYANELHRDITLTLAREIEIVAKQIVLDQVSLSTDDSSVPDAFVDLRSAAINYVTEMGSNGIFFTPEQDANDALDKLRDGGWILAGNYYQVLSKLESKNTFYVDSSHLPSKVIAPTTQEYQDHINDLDKSTKFYYNDNKTGFSQWEGRFYSPYKSPAQLSREEVEDAFDEGILDEIGISEASAEHMENFMNVLTGEQGSTDPVLRAAQFGQRLMETSANAMFALSIVLPVVASLWGWCTAQLPGETIFTGMIASALPIAYGLLTFMYLQGAALGIYLPMVPFIIFVIGGIGWVFAVVESMVAAPLVALGMTLPEGHEIYGRAEPAYMLLINLFLRPSLMILGFLCAMLVAWLAVDLVNISVYSALQFGGIVPDKWFGHHVVSFMYAGIVITIITKVFGLINLVPERVLRWIGDTSSPFLSAEETLSGARSGAQDTAKQTGDSTGSIGRAGTDAGTALGRYTNLKKDPAIGGPAPGNNGPAPVNNPPANQQNQNP